MDGAGAVVVMVGAEEIEEVGIGMDGAEEFVLGAEFDEADGFAVERAAIDFPAGLGEEGLGDGAVRDATGGTPLGGVEGGEAGGEFGIGDGRHAGKS